MRLRIGKFLFDVSADYPLLKDEAEPEGSTVVSQEFPAIKEGLNQEVRPASRKSSPINTYGYSRVAILGLFAVALVGILAVCILFITNRTSIPSASNPFIALAGVSKPEFPAKAAELVRSAGSANEKQTAQEVLRAAAALAKPGVLAYVVSSICHEVPEVAAVAVATAIELQPADVNSFVWGAARNAPQKAEQITYSACQSASNSFDYVALIVSQAAPTARSGILRGLTNALPQLQSTIEKAILQTGTDEIGPVMKQTLLLCTLTRQNK